MAKSPPPDSPGIVDWHRGSSRSAPISCFGTRSALVVVPVVWIVDVALSPGNALGGAIGDAFTLEHFERLDRRRVVLALDPQLA